MNFYLVLPLIACVFLLTLAIVVLWRDRRSFSHQLFASMLLCGALWGFTIFGMRASPDLEYALPWEKAVIVMIDATSVLLYHFSLTYTGIKRRRGLLPVAYLFLFIIAILAPTNLVVGGMQLKPYGYAPVPGPLFIFPHLFGVYLFVVLAVVNFVRAYRASNVYEVRNRYLYIIIGVTISLIGGVFDILPVFGLPLYPGAIIGNIIFCLLASVAVLRYHLLDIHIVVRKGTAYFLMSAAAAILYMGVILLFNQLFEEAVPFWAHLILLALLIITLLPLWSRMQRLADRWSYRERYDFLKALEDFSHETHKISNPNQLGSSLVKLISQALQSSSVCLLLPSSSGDFSVAASVGETTFQLSLDSYSPLLRWLQFNKSMLHRQDLDIIPQLQSLTEKETSQLKKIRAELFVPIITKEKELIGIFILGPKLSQQPYSEQDERLVSTVASRIAIELENARLYALETMLRQELQRQNEQKTEFLHSVAHELKTPLTAIISSSELLGTELSSTTPSQGQRLIRNINRSAWLMDKRVAELLDLAKMQVGDLELKSEPLEIGVIIEEVASQLLSLFKNKEQSLKLEIPDSLSPVKADGEKLEQILVNLLSNANKFSPTGSNITLRAREVDNRVIVEVEDSASAITEEEKVKLFDPYYRTGDAGKRQRIPGLGLGLAISRKLVELQRGEMWVKSEAGKGNTFAFSLPTYNREQRELGNSIPLHKNGR